MVNDIAWTEAASLAGNGAGIELVEGATLLQVARRSVERPGQQAKREEPENCA
jgi:hypothetical protein